MKLSVLSRYLMKEVAQAWFAAAVVLVAVLMTNRLVRYLADAASGKLPAEAIFSLLGLKMLGYMGLILPAAFFLGIVLAFGRLYRDSEMSALAACGGGPAALYKALYLLAVPLALLVGGLGLAVGPWAEYKAAQVAVQAQHNMELEMLRAGRFLTSRRADGMFYMETLSPDALRMGNVVVVSEGDDGRVTIVSAAGGRQERAASGSRYIVMEDGFRYEGVPGQSAWRVVEFEEHGVLIQPAQPPGPRIRMSGTPTLELWQRGSARDWGELHWRLSMPVMALLLTLIAVPLSKAEPREGRYGKLLAAVLVYVAYSNGLTVGQEWVRDGRVSPLLGLWWVHGLFAAAALAWLGHRYGWLRARLKGAAA